MRPATPAQVRRVEPIAAVLAPADRPAGRPLIVAMDGRSVGRRATTAERMAATTAERMAATVPGAAVVHTDGDDAAAAAFWDEWEAEEVPFLVADRPWERADHLVSGGSRSGTTRPPGWSRPTG